MMGDMMGGGGMDDLFALSAAGPLMPTSAPPSATPTPTQSRHGSTASGLDMMSGMGDFLGSPAVAPSRQPSRQPARASPAERSLWGDDPFGGGGGGGPKLTVEGGATREQLRLQKEQEKEAAMAEKVRQLKEKEDSVESMRELERTLEKTVKARVQQWQKEKKNLRALLASLHEIAPPCSWKPVSLAALIDPSMVKKSYRKAILAVHPDKQDPENVEQKVLAQQVFDALRDAWHIFEQTS